MEKRVLFGRRIIYSDETVVTKGNIVSIIDKAMIPHRTNADECEYLYNYYKGKQPVLERVNAIRPELTARVIENRANEIVSFKVGYLMGEPIQYISRSDDEAVAEAINTLNEYTYAEDKDAEDRELSEWSHICGTSYRMVLPDAETEADDSPFELHTLDPRSTFVVYARSLGHRPLLGVTYVTDDNGVVTYDCYTDRMYFKVVGNKVVMETPHILGSIPIIEYPANRARLGAFEIVLPLLDAINDVSSGRIEAIDEFVEAFLMLKGVDMTAEEFDEFKREGAIKLPPDGDAKYIVNELNQTQTQTLIDHMYQTILTICGMPNRNGGSSTSDTGAASMLRDGWVGAEGRAKDSELVFKKSEREFLKIVLKIVNSFKGVNLKLSDIEIRFTRRNYEHIESKSNVLVSMLSNDKIHPRLAFEYSGMFVDPELAYLESMEYAKQREEEVLQELEDFRKEEIKQAETPAKTGETE